MNAASVGGPAPPAAIAVALFAASQSDANGPKRHIVRCSVMSGVEVKADSKSIASFGR